MMRIITGTARGTKLLSLEGETTRPTSERTKEAVFSSLASQVAGRCVLDLFAGSGQMALEALSRGADLAYMVDASRDAVAILRQNAQKTHLEAKTHIYQSYFESFIQSVKPERLFDLIFIDPPFAKKMVPVALECLIAAGLIAPEAIIVCESEEDDILAGHDGLKEYFQVKKQARYARAHITILERRREL